MTIHFACLDHLPCAVAEVERCRVVNEQQAEGWIKTHNELMRGKELLMQTTVRMVALDIEVTRLRSENAELRRRLGEVGP